MIRGGVTWGGSGPWRPPRRPAFPPVGAAGAFSLCGDGLGSAGAIRHQLNRHAVSGQRRVGLFDHHRPKLGHPAGELRALLGGQQRAGAGAVLPAVDALGLARGEQHQAVAEAGDAAVALPGEQQAAGLHHTAVGVRVVLVHPAVRLHCHQVAGGDDFGAAHAGPGRKGGGRPTRRGIWGRLKHLPTALRLAAHRGRRLGAPGKSDPIDAHWQNESGPCWLLLFLSACVRGDEGAEHSWWDAD